jgi:hypothetical protein
MIHRIFLAMTNRYSGVECRRCGTALGTRDPLGMSEGVCGACRS